MEHDLIYTLKLKENLEETKNVLEEKISLCKEENDFLKERLKTYDENTNEEQFKIFEKEILKVREMLNEKTMDFIKFENIQKRNYEDISKKYNQIKQNLEEIKGENIKYSDAIKNISVNLSRNNLQEINDIIKNLNESTYNFIEYQQQKSLPNQNYNETDSYIGILEDKSDPNIAFNEEKNTFANKVIEEFDKVFYNEIKRLQNHYKKPEELKQVRRSSYVRRSSGVKNYIAYNEKSPNQKFAEGLRSADGKRPSNNVNISMRASNASFANNFSMLFDKKSSNLNVSNNSDIENMLNQAKDRVRTSISLSGMNLIQSGNLSSNKMIHSQSPIRNDVELNISREKFFDYKISKGNFKGINNSSLKKTNNIGKFKE